MYKFCIFALFGFYSFFPMALNSKVRSKSGSFQAFSACKTIFSSFLLIFGVIPEDNFIKIDGSWKYNSPNTKRIRKYFLKFRPDLFYYEKNPIVYDKNDKNKLERHEAKLADKLRNREWGVFGPSWKKR